MSSDLISYVRTSHDPTIHDLANDVSNKSGPEKRPVVDHVHPLVYTAVVGLALWFVVAAVLGFGSDGYADFLLVVVSTFIVIAVAIPCVLGLVWYRHREDEPSAQAQGERHGEGRELFRDWAAGELDGRTASPDAMRRSRYCCHWRRSRSA